MKFGSRNFSPRPLTTSLAIVMITVLALLGRWQLQRASQKQLLYDAFEKGTDATMELGMATPPVARYQHIDGHGSYDSAHQILIDNMSDAHGRAGYFVVTPFLLADHSSVLVNRGWVPVGVNRASLPPIDVSATPRNMRGRADHLPTPGIQLGAHIVLQPPFPVVASFPSRAEIRDLIHEPSWTDATDLVLLDADQPDGYARDWQPPGFPPLRNVAYAVQWFGLALALAVIYVVTNLHRTVDVKALT